MEWLLANTTYLLAGHATVSDLLSAYSDAQRTAATAPSDDGAHRSVIALEQHIGTVEEAAHYRDTSVSYNNLMRQFTTGATVFIAAVVVFAVSGLLAKPTPAQPSNPVTEPIPVHVVDLSPPPDTPKECQTRDGVAIGGTLTTPTVAVSPTETCPAATLSRGPTPPRSDPSAPARQLALAGQYTEGPTAPTLTPPGHAAHAIRRCTGRR